VENNIKQKHTLPSKRKDILNEIPIKPSGTFQLEKSNLFRNRTEHRTHAVPVSSAIIIRTLLLQLNRRDCKNIILSKERTAGTVKHCVW
jgi:hypothetical protein